jgi:membrane-associated phospholipid phosphatase
MEDIMPLYMLVKAMTFTAVVLFWTSTGATVVTDWNSAALAEVRLSTSPRNGPPMVARALAIAHTCMYDAWAAYDKNAVGTTDLSGQRRRPVNEHKDDKKAKAISFAAYRCLVNLFPDGASRLENVLDSQGYDHHDNSIDPTTPAGIGNVAAQAVIIARSGDGSNQYGDLTNPQNPSIHCPDLTGSYSDYTCYQPRNEPMEYCTPLMSKCKQLHIDDPNHWQPLIGPPEFGSVTQGCIGPHWEHVAPFALTSDDQFDATAIAIGLPPDIFTDAAHYAQNVDQILLYSAQLNAERKLIVEYWADGPASELPPGHWGVLAQFVSQRDNHSIDEDVKMFFAMHNASSDAGIVAWHLKRKYDSVRPITAIRYLYQGQTVLAWGGPGQPIEQIPGEKWIPYNPGKNLTPAFPGYISGHSTFSSASATVLQLFTGSNYFGFSTIIPANFGRVEPGIPAVPTPVSFATFSAAAEQAGLSRLYGGIHFPEDNTVGQALGALIGQQAWAKAQTYFNGAP